MSRPSKVTKYNPSLTPEENAKRNGVSVSTIRYYIQKHGIDRNYDREINTIEKCRKYLKTHPDATDAEMHRELGCALNTLRKYRKYIRGEEIPSNFNKNKLKKRTLRQVNNFYATDPTVVMDLLREERFNDRILEPFCGSGLLSNAIKEFGYEVDSYDLVDRGFGNVGEFFSTDYPKGYYDIITNPPYDAKILNQIFLRCIDLCVGKVAMLLPLDYLNGKSRYEEVFKNLPPKTIYVYVNRIGIGKNGNFDETIGNKVVYAWYVWHKGYKGKTELRWITNKKNTTTPQDLLKEIKDYIDVEHGCTEWIESKKDYLPYPTKKDLYKIEDEEYDAFRYPCYAFRRKEDTRKGEKIPLGNMNSGFPFKIGSITFPTSEHAYIFGLFSNGTPIHEEIQRLLLNEPNGYIAKRKIRRENERYGRKDWEEFNVEWMLYCIWMKAKGNEEFRNLLLSIPQGATIIENSTFQPKPSDKNAIDKPAFWGCRNYEQKDFHRLVSKYVAGFGGSDSEQKAKVAEYMDDFCNYGLFVGRNTMGKILMIVKKCLHEGTEPDIDYDLLTQKSIWLLGSPVSEQWSKSKIDFSLDDWYSAINKSGEDGKE